MIRGYAAARLKQLHRELELEAGVDVLQVDPEQVLDASKTVTQGPGRAAQDGN